MDQLAIEEVPARTLIDAVKDPADLAESEDWLGRTKEILRSGERNAAVRDQADASARDPPAFSRALLQLTCGSRAIAVIQRDPIALQSRTRVPMPKVEVLSIDYRTPNPDRRSDRGRGIDLERMDVVVKLGCAHQFTFESARLMTDWLGSVEHQYDAVRAQFTIDCERCARCEVGLRLRAASAAKPPTMKKA